MINKKHGFLLAETVVKIVIALICVGFLIYLLFSLYYANQDAQKLKQADASLKIILDAVGSQESSVEIYNPVGSRPTWYIFTWPTGGDTITPKACSTNGWNNCICICAFRTYEAHSKQNLADSCDEKGVCKEFGDLKLNKDNGYFSQGRLYSPEDVIKISAPSLNLKINYQEKLITENGR